MEIKKKIGQLLVVGFPGKEMTDDLKQLIHAYHVGSVILFAHNIGTPQEVLNLTTSIQREAKEAGYQYPMLIAIDEENGTVKRLGEGAGEYPGAMALSATENPKFAYDIGQATGDDLIRLGINWNYAPVLDINNNPKNPVIGVRSYGEDSETVAEFGISFMKGLQSAGVATSIKHFPGHGDTSMDSHYSLPRIEHSIERLREMELVPFKKAIAEDPDSVMTAHIVFPALEPEEGLPATLSKNILTGLLREELGFDGVIVTDSLEMEAISKTVGIPIGALKSLKAGADMLLITHTPSEQFATLEKIEEAIEKGDVSLERIEKSLERIQKLKEKYLSWGDLLLTEHEVPTEFNSEEKQQLAQKVYENSVTILKSGEKVTKEMSVLVLQPKDELRTIAEDVTEDNFTLTQKIKEFIDDVEVELVTNDLSADQAAKILEKAKKVDRIIVGTMVAQEKDRIIDLIEKLCKNNVVDIISMKSPYVGQWLTEVNSWINTYEPSSIPVDLAVRTLLGEIQPTGVSPVTLK